MCCCGKPVVNGQPGYSWDGKSFSIRPVNPPDIKDGDVLMYDEPGRCGGIDSHSHHFRVVNSGGVWSNAILVRHGGGDERISLSSVGRLMLPMLAKLDSNERYWLLHTIYSAHEDAIARTREKQNLFWMTAAAEKKIKTRKVHGGVKVWIEDKTSISA